MGHKTDAGSKRIHVGTNQSKIEKLGPACTCRACSIGCEYGSGILIGDDEKRIAKFLKMTREQLIKVYLEKVEQMGRRFLRPVLKKQPGRPYGRCVFYSQQRGCKIHPVKPLQCKLASGCSPYGEEISAWFLVNHLLDRSNPESLRQYAHYLTSGGKLIKGGSVEELVPDEKKRKEMLNYGELKLNVKKGK